MVKWCFTGAPTKLNCGREAGLAGGRVSGGGALESEEPGLAVFNSCGGRFLHIKNDCIEISSVEPEIPMLYNFKTS